ncbi:MAG: MoaD/ThiS family protein [marine benthic group bacterium]|nr:MoaD/ThiS family protein [Candidatus Benthicola marisminoris]
MTEGFEVTVLLFGRHRELAGESALSVSLAEGATVRHIREALDEHPALTGLAGTAAIALNHRYEPDDSPVTRGDEIALIPPVAGG